MSKGSLIASCKRLSRLLVEKDLSREALRRFSGGELMKMSVAARRGAVCPREPERDTWGMIQFFPASPALWKGGNRS